MAELKAETLISKLNKLSALTVLECIENHGDCLKDLIDGIYLICEEITRVVPAHSRTETTDPDLGDDYIDLFCAETGADLSRAVYLLGNRLPPGVRSLIFHRMERRIILPFRNNRDFRWRFQWKSNSDAPAAAMAVIRTFCACTGIWTRWNRPG